MRNYSRNWQYAITKEVLAIHETISPYDWSLDIEESNDFVMWANELKKKIKWKSND